MKRLATDAASGAVGQVIGDVSDNSVDEHEERVKDLTVQDWNEICRSGEVMAEVPMDEFLVRRGTNKRGTGYRLPQGEQGTGG